MTKDRRGDIRPHWAAPGYLLVSGGRVTGDGFDCLICDDPHNATEAASDVERASTLLWHDSALSTRDNDPKTSVRVYIMQRLHEDDVAGHILEQEIVDAHLCFPARYEAEHPHKTFSPIRSNIDPRKEEGELLWPDRFGDDELRKLERVLGTYGAAGQLQQRPAPAEGGIIKPDRIELIEDLPDKPVEFKVRGWDFAGTEEIEGESDAAWTVGVLFTILRGDDHIYIEHLVRLRGGPETVKRVFIQTTHADGRDVLQDIPQDPGASGKYVCVDLVKSVKGYPVRFSPESGDKTIRAMPFSDDIENYRVKAVTEDWWLPYRDELAHFPMGKYKDQVDASSRAHRQICMMIERFGAPAGEGVTKMEEEKARAKAEREAEDLALQGDVGLVSEEEKEASIAGKVSVVAF